MQQRRSDWREEDWDAERQRGRESWQSEPRWGGERGGRGEEPWYSGEGRGGQGRRHMGGEGWGGREESYGSGGGRHGPSPYYGGGFGGGMREERGTYPGQGMVHRYGYGEPEGGYGYGRFGGGLGSGGLGGGGTFSRRGTLGGWESGAQDWGSGGREWGGSAGPGYGGYGGSAYPGREGGQGYGRGYGYGGSMGGAQTKRGPRNYRRSDERVREDVCDRLMESWIEVEEIEVTVKDGEVELTGTIDSGDARREVERIAESVPGVKDVNNKLRVKRDSGEGGEESGRMTGGRQQESGQGRMQGSTVGSTQGRNT